MTTYPITMPTSPSGFVSVEFGLNRASSVTRSPYTLAEQAYYHPAGAAWEGSVTLPPMKLATAAPWSAFLANLQGSFGTFTLSPPDRRSPQGTQASSFTISGSAFARATTVGVNGMTAGATLLTGDRISIGGVLYELTADVTADGGGAGTIYFQPGLRIPLSGGEGVNCDPPTFEARMTRPDNMPKLDWDGTYTVSFAFHEVIASG